jgi:cell division protein FtsZ
MQTLRHSGIPNRIQIGEALTQGSGCGAIPSLGEQAAREAEAKLREIVEGADMVFITAGMGGGTGTGAAPVIAEICRSMNVLNVAVVTKPFHFEGTQRMKRAIEGCRKLGEHVDTMICLLNDKLMEVVGPTTPLTEAFQVANSVLAQGIRAISDLIAMPGLINVDFRDVRTIMGETGGAVMGVGIGKGENRAVEAVRKACHSPLQEKIVIDGARGVLINITGPADMTMLEINEATSLIYEMADPEANVIFGVVIDEHMKDALRVTIIATGFHNSDDPFESVRDERLRPRPNRPRLPELKEEGAERSEDIEESDETADETEPAVLRRPEREPAAPSKLDFDSPANPMRNWNLRESAEKDAETGPNGETIRFAESSREKSAPAKAFADVEPRREAAEESDPYYESTAIQRRRRHRFFE